MLSNEFIPTSPSDEDFVENPTNISTKSAPKNSTNSPPLLHQNHPSAPKYTTNPEGIKFVPQPPVQFYYSLQKNSLRTVVDTLLTNSELAYICTVFRIPGYGKWLKKKMAADMLVDFLLTLKQAYKREAFNNIIENINSMKGREMLGRIPKLPNKVDALGVLKRSLELINQDSRPTFPVRLNYPLKEVTGMIYLDSADANDDAGFTVDLYFSIPGSVAPSERLILCAYQRNSQMISPISPTLLDLCLNGSNLELGNCRFRNHDCYDITLFCYKDRANLLRIIRHETHVDLKNLMIEIVAVSISGSLSESRPIHVIKRPRHTTTTDSSLPSLEDVKISRLREKYLREDLPVVEISRDASFKRLKGLDDSNSDDDDDDDDLEIVQDTLTFSLKCPISFTKIVTPVRFNTCKHGQCFDLTSWKQFTMNILNARAAALNKNALTNSNNNVKKFAAKVSCPICGFDLELEDQQMTSTASYLVADGLFRSILKESNDNDEFVEINLKDGTFTLIQEESYDGYESSAEDEDVGVEEKVRIDGNCNGCSQNEEVISIVSSDGEDVNGMLGYKVDESKPLGSCMSRAISID